MVSRCLTCIVSVVLTLFATSAALAGNEALLIANSDYEHSNPLRNPTNDVKAMEHELKKLGFRVKIARNLGFLEFNRVLGEFQERAANADVAMVFYSGHGMESRGVNYLIPIDARLARPGAEQFEAVSLNNALDVVADAKTLKIVVIDACRNGAPGRERSGRSRGFVAVEANRAGLAIAFSTATGEPAFDGSGSLSPYTQALTEKLQRRPDLDVRKLFTSLEKETSKYAGGQQVPFARFGAMPEDDISITGQIVGPAKRQDTAPRSIERGKAIIWKGWHQCLRSRVGTLVRIVIGDDGRVGGVREFYPSSDDIKRSRGSFRVSGRFDPKTRAITLMAKDWIDHPPGYTKCDFIGKVDSTGRVISGTSPKCACGEFRLERE